AHRTASWAAVKRPGGRPHDLPSRQRAGGGRLVRLESLTYEEGKSGRRRKRPPGSLCHLSHGQREPEGSEHIEEGKSRRPPVPPLPWPARAGDRFVRSLSQSRTAEVGCSRRANLRFFSSGPGGRGGNAENACGCVDAKRAGAPQRTWRRAGAVAQIACETCLDRGRTSGAPVWTTDAAFAGPPSPPARFPPAEGL